MMLGKDMMIVEALLSFPWHAKAVKSDLTQLGKKEDGGAWGQSVTRMRFGAIIRARPGLGQQSAIRYIGQGRLDESTVTPVSGALRVLRMADSVIKQDCESTRLYPNLSVLRHRRGV
jgi:hypothetical protein